MKEQVRLCAVWPMENWLSSSLSEIQGWTTVPDSYSRALEQGTLTCTALFGKLGRSPPDAGGTANRESERGPTGEHPFRHSDEWNCILLIRKWSDMKNYKTTEGTQWFSKLKQRSYSKFISINVTIFDVSHQCQNMPKLLYGEIGKLVGLGACLADWNDDSITKMAKRELPFPHCKKLQMQEFSHVQCKTRP